MNKTNYKQIIIDVFRDKEQPYVFSFKELAEEASNASNFFTGCKNVIDCFKEESRAWELQGYIPVCRLTKTFEVTSIVMDTEYMLRRSDIEKLEQAIMQAEQELQEEQRQKLQAEQAIVQAEQKLQAEQELIKDAPNKQLQQITIPGNVRQFTAEQIELLKSYFSPNFKGMGGNLNRFEENLLIDLKKKRTGLEYAKIAKLIYESEQSAPKLKEKPFTTWYETFCGLMGIKKCTYRLSQINIDERIRNDFFYIT